MICKLTATLVIDLTPNTVEDIDQRIDRIFNQFVAEETQYTIEKDYKPQEGEAVARSQF